MKIVVENSRIQKAGILANDKLVRENSCKVLEHANCDRLEIEITPRVSEEIKVLRLPCNFRDNPLKFRG